jgi:hypothetical protein
MTQCGRIFNAFEAKSPPTGRKRSAAFTPLQLLNVKELSEITLQSNIEAG